MVELNKARKECFLCGREIEGKSTKEHIFANSFLREHDLKRERLRFGAPDPTEYSRIKVAVHEKCNSAMGSQFESDLLGIIRSMDKNANVTRQLHLPSGSESVRAVKRILCQWLAKLHIGLIYWEVNLLRHPNPGHQESLRQYLRSPVVRYLQQSVQESYSFKCPSSLYHFTVPRSGDAALRFDFASHHGISGSFIKFGDHLLVVTIGDGYLVEDWFGDHQWKIIQDHVTTNSENEPLSYLAAVAEIWAVRELLPVRPKLKFTPEGILDRSRDGFAQKPPIDEQQVGIQARKIEQALGERFVGSN